MPHYTGFHGELSDIHYVQESGRDMPCLSLSVMAYKALRYLYNNPMPEHDWQCRFSFAPSCLPPFCPDQQLGSFGGMVDPISEGDTESRNDVVFSMMREILSDEETGLEAEEQVHERLISYVKEEGFGRGLCWTHGYSACVTEDKTFASLWATGMLLHSECLRCRAGKGDATLARALFEGLMDAATREDGRAYYRFGHAFYDENGGVEAYKGHYPTVLSGLCEYWLLTGDDRCWDLMTEIAEGFVCDLQPDNLHRCDGGIDGHNHCQLHAVRGMAQFAYLSGEPRYLTWVKDIYDFYRKWALDTGWLPEIRDLEDHSSHSETCLNSDMLEVELWLALAGYDELWDQMDRSLRNYFAPLQFTLTKELTDWYRKVHADAPSEEVEKALRTLKELEGGFISAVTPNDYIFEVREGGKHFGSVHQDGRDIVFDMMGCCPPEGMRAIYWAWKYAQQSEDGTTVVHLPIDSDSPRAQVRSELPNCGRLSITIKLAGDLMVRIPKWAPRGEVTVMVNGEAQPVIWCGPAQQYVYIGGLLAGDEAEVSHPLIDLWQTVQVTPYRQETQTYRYHWLGNAVVDVEPQGKYMPLYGNK